VRTLIEQRLAIRRSQTDPRARLLGHVIGEASAELLGAIDGSQRQAAVLLGLVDRTEGLHVLFTERAAHLAHHPGQISFPGGRIEGDHETPVDAALREAREEVGLERGDVTIVGSLDPHVTGTGFCVTPVVGFIAGGFVPRPDPAEVNDVFEVPLSFLLDPGSVRETVRQRLGSRFRTYEFYFENRLIWGATAAILVTFRDLLSNE
jgi:8-oxo-dGTP pyrophosphatase MutT (NUDIX family)